MHLWLWWTTSIHVHAADDSLKPGDTLNSSSPLLYSKSRKYLLEFITFVSESESLTYLVIIYENDKVWYGNREEPVV